MSFSEYVVSIVQTDRENSESQPVTVAGTGFDIAEGLLSLGWAWEAQTLKTPGVDGERQRRNRKGVIPLILVITEPLAVGADYFTREQDYATLIGRQCTLSVGINPNARQWKRATVKTVQVTLRGGALAGFGSIAGSTKTLVATWTETRQQQAEL
jgi:hypothetical protein